MVAQLRDTVDQFTVMMQNLAKEQSYVSKYLHDPISAYSPSVSTFRIIYPEYAPTVLDEVPETVWHSFIVGQGLSSDQRYLLFSLSRRFSTCFLTEKNPIGDCTVCSHYIDTGTHRPVQQTLRQFGFDHRNKKSKQIKFMLSSGVTAPCYDI